MVSLSREYTRVFFPEFYFPIKQTKEPRLTWKDIFGRTFFRFSLLAVLILPLLALMSVIVLLLPIPLVVLAFLVISLRNGLAAFLLLEDTIDSSFLQLTDESSMLELSSAMDTD